MGKLLSSSAPPPADDDDFSYWPYKELHARGIVRSRPDLANKIARYGFPRPIVLTGGVGANALYKVSAVKAWLQEREQAGARNAPPELKPDGPRRGRPRKNPILEEEQTTT